MWYKTAIGSFAVLLQNFPGQNKKQQRKTQRGSSVFRPTFEPETSRRQVEGVTVSVNQFGNFYVTPDEFSIGGICTGWKYTHKRTNQWQILQFVYVVILTTQIEQSGGTRTSLVPAKYLLLLGRAKPVPHLYTPVNNQLSRRSKCIRPFQAGRSNDRVTTLTPLGGLSFMPRAQQTHGSS